MQPLKSKWGSVKPYSRHSPNCVNFDHPNINECRCPKWLYVYKRGEKRKRYALNTPSLGRNPIILRPPAPDRRARFRPVYLYPANQQQR